MLNLSDDSNTLSNHIAFAVKKDIETKTAAVMASVNTMSNIQLSEDESDAEDLSSQHKKATKQEVTLSPEDGKLKTFTPRKPRRIPLISTKRKSPIKNGSTWFESRHDPNNLDKNLSSNASLILDQHLGEEASIDLGLEVTGNEVENDVEIVRKSPRKHKRKASKSPHRDSTPTKKAKLPEQAEFTDRKELTLSFSPEKRSERSSTHQEENVERSTTPTFCKALGLQRNESFREGEEISQPVTRGRHSQMKKDEKEKETKSKSKSRKEKESLKVKHTTKSKVPKEKRSDGENKNSELGAEKGRREERTPENRTESEAKKEKESSKVKHTDSRQSKSRVTSNDKASKNSSDSSSKESSYSSSKSNVSVVKPKKEDKLKKDSYSSVLSQKAPKFSIPKISVSSPRKSDRRVPNILSKSPLNNANGEKKKPSTREKDFIKKDSSKSVDKMNKPSTKEQDLSKKVSPKSVDKEKVKPKVPPAKEIVSGTVKDGRVEATPTAGLTFQQMAVESEKILTTLGRLRQESKKEDESKSNPLEGAQPSKFGLSRTSLFVFHERLPFGVFEEDL